MDNQSERTVTVLIPCYNEQESLPILFNRLDNLINSQQENRKYTTHFSILLVDDGSKDKTRDLIKEYSITNTYTSYIFLSRNFGKEKAILAGIDATNTDGLIIIDADLQDPPELIPEMIDLWHQGYEDIYARRRTRKGESWLKKATSHCYYSLLQQCTNITIQRDTGDFRLLDKKCINALKQLRESERNSKALFSWIGFKKIEFLYDRDPRIAGKTKWNYFKLFQLALDGITSFTIAPLRMVTYCGVITSLCAIIYAAYIFIRTVIYGIDVPGYASLIVILLVLGGIELLGLGIIGEYLGRIFMQTKDRPIYLVEEEHLESQASDTRPIVRNR